MAFDGRYNGRQVLDTNGDPVSGARIFFYRHGTVIAQNVWEDEDLTTLSANPVVADSAGYYDAFISSALDYDVVVKSSDDSITYATEAYSSSSSSGSSGGDSGSTDAFIVVDTIAELEALTGTTPEDVVSLVLAGREGLFVWDSSDLSASVTADPLQGIHVAPDTDDTGASGAWVRQFVGEVNATWYGAIGDSSTDNAAALTAAIAGGYNVYIPPLLAGAYYAIATPVNVTTSGQKIRGGGIRTEIRQSGSGSDSIGFNVVASTEVQFHDMYVIPGDPGTASGSTYWGWAFYFGTGSHRGRVTNCDVTDHRRGAIMCVGSNACEFDSNRIRDSVVDPATDDSSESGTDIFLCNGSNRCQVHDNIIDAGAGTGIAVQSITRTDNNFNVISNNVVTNCPSYGIILYVGDAADEVDHCVIADNIIDTVYGNIESSGQGDYPFGAGIYLQGAEHATVTGNTVRNTSVNTDSSLLTPAAIGMINARSAVISNNSIFDAVQYGIMVSDVNENGSITDGLVNITGNKIYNPTLSGIYAKDMPRGICSDNDVISGGSYGILIQDTTTTATENWTIKGNYIEDSGNAGMFINDTSFCIISDNQVHNATNSGIVVNDGAAVIKGNISADCSSYGFVIGASVTGGTIVGNHAHGNLRNYSMDGAIIFDPNENYSSSPTNGDYLGDSIPWVNLTGSDTTPSMRGIKYALTNNAALTQITTFDDMQNGQEVTIRVQDAETRFVNSANFRLEGSTNYDASNGDVLTFVNRAGAITEKSRMTV